MANKNAKRKQQEADVTEFSAVNQRILDEIEIEESVRKRKSEVSENVGIQPKRRRRKVEFGLNVETLSLNAMIACGNLGLCCGDGIPDDFFTGPPGYRKKGSFISE